MMIDDSKGIPTAPIARNPSIWLTGEEVKVVKDALRFYYDNLQDDQHDGGDHGDEIDALEGLNYKVGFIDGTPAQHDWDSTDAGLIGHDEMPATWLTENGG